MIKLKRQFTFKEPDYDLSKPVFHRGKLKLLKVPRALLDRFPTDEFYSRFKIIKDQFVFFENWQEHDGRRPCRFIRNRS